MSDLTLKDVAAALERSAELEKRYRALWAEGDAIHQSMNAIADERRQLALTIAGFIVQHAPSLAVSLEDAVRQARDEQRIAAKERQ